MVAVGPAAVDVARAEEGDDAAVEGQGVQPVFGALHVGDSVAEIEDGVEYRVILGETDEFGLGHDAGELDLGHVAEKEVVEAAPAEVALADDAVLGEEEAAAQKVFAEVGAFGVGEDGREFAVHKEERVGGEIGGGEARAGDLEAGFAAASRGRAEEDDPSFVGGLAGGRGGWSEGGEDGVAAEAFAGSAEDGDGGGGEAAGEEPLAQGFGVGLETAGLGFAGGETDDDDGARRGKSGCAQTGAEKRKNQQYAEPRHGCVRGGRGRRQKT